MKGGTRRPTDKKKKRKKVAGLHGRMVSGSKTEQEKIAFHQTDELHYSLKLALQLQASKMFQRLEERMDCIYHYPFLLYVP